MLPINHSFRLNLPILFSTILLLSTSVNTAKAEPTKEIDLSTQVTETTEVNEEFSVNADILNPQGFDELSSDPMSQVTSVSELRDVQPTEWAYEALRSLVERYGCIVGYPDRTYRGDRALSRWEFAAGLNACMNVMERLIQENVSILKEDVDKLKRLMQEFEAELAALGARVDNLEGRVSFLEEHQFSTTTKLVGEVAFTLAQAFGEEGDAQATFSDRVRLQLATSFTGKDVLYTRLTAGNLGNSFQDEIGDFQGRFAYDGQDGNNVTIDRLHYYFPVGENLKIFTMASLGGHHFYADTFNPGLEAGGGANGSLSRFFERNPIYRLGLGGQGIGATYKVGNTFQLSAGYLAKGGNDPSPGAGLFNGNYSILGQLVYSPTDRLKFGLTYVHAYDVDAQTFGFGATGTLAGNLKGLGINDLPVSSNSYGIEGQFDISPKFSVRAWGSFTDAKIIEFGDAEIWSYGLVLAFPDLGKEGSLGYLGFGAEPYLGGIEIPSNPDFDDDTPFHIEVAYKYPLTDNISITPGLIILTAPNQNSDNDTVFIGALRTTFKF